MQVAVGKQSRFRRLSLTSVRIFLVLVPWFLAFCVSAQDQRLFQYTHRSWPVRDGFFTGLPRAITQTKDGHIWVGTDSGLLRYDGSRFEAWTSPDGRKLPSDEIGAVLGAHDGSLWIGTLGGLAHFIDHKLIVYSDFHGDVASIVEDHTGNIWFGRSDAANALRTP